MSIAEPSSGTPAFAFFSHLASLYGRTRLTVVCVAHFVETTLHFLPAISRIADVALVLPKPRSIQPDVRVAIERDYAVEGLSRSFAEDHTELIRCIDSAVGSANEICLVDIGGYFASAIQPLKTHFGEALRGVVEGTENGVQKYEKDVGNLPVPLYSVARSPLKYPENHLVGSGVAFSIEAILRERGEVLQGLRATVIGYGRIGRGVAHALRGRDLDVVVYDIDAIALAEAAAHGFQIARTTDRALADAGLVVCATGNAALRGPHFSLLQGDAYVASVTSADDEMALDEIGPGYVRTEVARHVTRYRRNHHSFFLLNEGNAVNFLHGGVLGSAIHLVEGEKLACINAVASHTEGPGYHELTRNERTPIAKIWLQHFSPT